MGVCKCKCAYSGRGRNDGSVSRSARVITCTDGRTQTEAAATELSQQIMTIAATYLAGQGLADAGRGVGSGLERHGLGKSAKKMATS